MHCPFQSEQSYVDKSMPCTVYACLVLICRSAIPCKTAMLNIAGCACAVFMGMGEPLLNLRAVTAAAQFLIRDLGIGARHLTISTVGVPNAIGMLAERLVKEQLQVTLAVSLHAPDQALRQRLVPR